MFGWLKRKKEVGVARVDWRRTCAIDLRRMRVFSVERVVDDGDVVTVIGYYDNDGDLQTWYLRIVDAEHDRLVKEMNEIIAERKSRIDARHTKTE